MSTTHSMITLLVFGCLQAMVGQSGDLTLIGAGGGMSQNGNRYLSYSVGEPCIHHPLNAGYWLTEGFQQPDRIDLTTSIGSADKIPELSISPNPTSSAIWISGMEEWTCSEVRLTDMMGRILFSGNITSAPLFTISLAHLPQGLYLVSIQCKSSGLFSKRIIKI